MRPKSILPIIVIFSAIAIGVDTPAAIAQSDPAALFHRGILYFDAGNYNQAYDLLFKAFQADPANLEINFYLGRAAFETGNYEMALMAYERILIAEPDAVRVKLEMARTYYRLGLLESARQTFEEVLTANPPLPVRININSFLAAIAKTEKRHFFSGFLLTACDWDDNVYAAPASDIIDTTAGDVVLTGTGSQETADWLLNTTAILNHTYRFTDSPFAWFSSGNVYQSLYLEEEELNTSFLELSSGPRIYTDQYQLGVSGLMNHVRLDWDSYLTSKGFETIFSWIIKPNALLNIGQRFEDRSFDQMDERDSQNINLAIGPVLWIGANYITVAASGEINDARESEYSYKQLGGKIFLERALPWGLSAFGSYEYRYRPYNGTYELFDKERIDQLHDARVGLTKTIWKSRTNLGRLAFQISYRYLNADSNIELYEYDKNVLSGGLRYDF